MQVEKVEFPQCWKNERIDQVINKEAASVDQATFLATHMPMHNIAYSRQPHLITDTSEEGLLRELRHCADENNHAFIAVQGIPGTGKSHLIRWLKERYAAENDQEDCVLFIERAQCSLSGTLEQIITSGIFDDITMHDQLEKLRGARSALSKDALADTLLDQLRIASSEEQQVEVPSWLRHGERLKKFLLDYRIRQELTKLDGPIERLMRFLTNGPGSGMYTGEVPQFEEKDFDFKTQVRQEIQGYQEAKNVADRLSGEDGLEKRQQLVNYLNSFIHYAIGHATALTSDDFKQVFYDLRRSLYEQNRSLTLFIEDITVLTGVDRGLLDVLVTQHKGVGEQNLCRLISVIGITDSYFIDQIPDNIKDRITYHITLSSSNETTVFSKLEDVANLAVRYLNAMRLDQTDLEKWLNLGGKSNDLPNACHSCPVRTACHNAFGFYTVNVGSEQQQQIGLYPFNSKAIWTLYQHLDTTKSRRTQRALLYNVLHYVMQSHGARIKRREFPPASSELGGEFTVFSLEKPLQREVIRSQGGYDAGRIMTLVIIWGDGTIDATKDVNGNALVSNLSQAVFQAFGITPIAGEHLTYADSPLAYRIIAESRPSTPSISLGMTIAASKPPAVSSASLPLEQPALSSRQMEKLREYNKDIEQWLNGEPLRYYEDYSDWLVPLIRSFIDWDFYSISSIQLDEVLKGRRHLHIENQVGKVNAAYYLTLPRSPELAAVLLGLATTRESGQQLEPVVLSGYLSSFSLWLHRYEEEIVQFVRQPNHASTNVIPLTQLLVLDCLLLACLQGTLKAGYATTQDLFVDLVSFCRQTTASSWEEQIRIAQEKYASRRASLMKRMKPQVVEKLCSDCLRVLNRAQGSSDEVLFLDTATGLRILNDFQECDWYLPDPALEGTTTLSSWANALSTYTALREYFSSILQEEQLLTNKILSELYVFIGDDSYQSIFAAIDKLIEIMKESKRGISFEQKKQFNATNLRAVTKDLRSIANESSRKQWSLRLAHIDERLVGARKYIEYFNILEHEIQKLRQESMAYLTKLQEQMGIGLQQENEQVKAAYCKISKQLASWNMTGEQE